MFTESHLLLFSEVGCGTQTPTVGYENSHTYTCYSSFKKPTKPSIKDLLQTACCVEVTWNYGFKLKCILNSSTTSICD